MSAANNFIHHTIKIASQCSLPVHVCDETLQTGNSFGEKLANAIAQTFAKGYSKLIIIGNDCPGLTELTIEKAASELEHHDLVLGPTSKGGVYLIGITAAAFKKHKFKKISWQTASVFSELKAIGNATDSSVSCLPVLDDINTASDVIAIAKNYPAIHSWTHVLLQYLMSAISSHHYKGVIIPYVAVFAMGRRGPPPFGN